MKVISRGHHGTSVRKMTELLVEVGLLNEPVERFDRIVEKALRAWQAHGVDAEGNKLQVDGIYGPKTRESLINNPETIFSEPVPEKFYSVPKCGGTAIGRVALEYAIKEMEDGAKEVGGNNQGPYVKKYLGREDANDLKWAWCAAFTSWCFKQASDELDVPMPFEYTLGAQNIFHQLRDLDQSYEACDQNPPQPGDVCVWNRGTDEDWRGHVGIVWGTINGIVYVVEGNVGRFPARVRVFDYTLKELENNRLIGFGRPVTPVN